MEHQQLQRSRSEATHVYERISQRRYCHFKMCKIASMIVAVFLLPGCSGPSRSGTYTGGCHNTTMGGKGNAEITWPERT